MNGKFLASYTVATAAGYEWNFFTLYHSSVVLGVVFQADRFQFGEEPIGEW